MLPELAGHGLRAVSFDFPGVGLSDKPKDLDYGWHSLAKWVGRVVDAIDEMGELDNTLVIYTTDHGDWLGDHGLILKGPMPYEGLLRVGCIARGPGVPQMTTSPSMGDRVAAMPTACSAAAPDRALWNAG